MNGTKVFRINSKLIELPLFEKDDRVSLKDNMTTAVNPVGTVENVSEDGLFIYIKWDNKEYPSKAGGNVELGRGWMASSVVSLNS